jgi:hypothetical protein
MLGTDGECRRSAGNDNIGGRSADAAASQTVIFI